MSAPKETDPWEIAKVNGRVYLTPEDLGEAAEAGATRQSLLVAFAEAVECNACEDRKTCAFVVLNMDPSWKTKRIPSRREQR